MPETTEYKRSLYDRRSGFERRKDSNTYEKERRCNMERRYLGENRSDWIRDTQWSSVNIELLR